MVQLNNQIFFTFDQLIGLEESNRKVLYCIDS